MEFASCYKLTFVPHFLEQVYSSDEEVPSKLSSEAASELDIEENSYLDNEGAFLFNFHDDQIEVHGLSEGMSQLAADAALLK